MQSENLRSKHVLRMSGRKSNVSGKLAISVKNTKILVRPFFQVGISVTCLNFMIIRVNELSAMSYFPCLLILILFNLLGYKIRYILAFWACNCYKIRYVVWILSVTLFNFIINLYQKNVKMKKNSVNWKSICSNCRWLHQSSSPLMRKSNPT